jgi:succinate-semialdehyde dehydrogenase/glutarate-semialdehyde dehydrogenase
MTDEMTDDQTSVQILNPWDHSVVGEVSLHTVKDCLDAGRRATEAFPTWSRTAPRERAEILRRTWELMIRDRDVLAKLITRESGKVLADSIAEVNYAAEFFRWFSEEAVRVDGDYRRAPSGAYNILVSREPVGVALLLAPWNFPAAMATRKVAPALAAGCTAVLKPAIETPLTTLAIAALMREAGLPDGVVEVITPNPPHDAVEALLSSQMIRKLSFTGSTRVGSLLLAQAAPHVINTTLELGGNAPFIVCEDADLEAAVDGAMIAKMRNGGAACTAANRFYVHTKVYSAFAEMLTERMSALVMGDGLDPSSNVGVMVNRSQQQRVAALVKEAVADGARITCGGRPATDGSCGYEPTVLIGVTHGSRITREEIFGPVAALIEIDDVESGIEMFNDVPHGLVSYLYTGDAGRGMRIASRLESGMVGLNRGLVSDPSAPFGGFKESGLGREGAHEGMLAFCETKYLAVEW